MLGSIQVPGGGEDLGLLQIMLAEHGPSGVFYMIVALLVWKVAVPTLKAIGEAAQTLFKKHLEQGEKSLERLASLETAFKDADKHTTVKLEAIRQSVDASNATVAGNLRVHDREIADLKSAHGEHEHRIRGLETLAGNSGVYRRPHPASHGD
jgi:hypothetical protein